MKHEPYTSTYFGLLKPHARTEPPSLRHVTQETRYPGGGGGLGSDPRCRQHRLMWRPKWDFTMVLSGFGDFRICAPGTGGWGGGMFWSGSDPRPAPIHGGGGGGTGEFWGRSDPRSMEYLVPTGSPYTLHLPNNTTQQTHTAEKTNPYRSHLEGTCQPENCSDTPSTPWSDH